MNDEEIKKLKARFKAAFPEAVEIKPNPDGSCPCCKEVVSLVHDLKIIEEHFGRKPKPKLN